MQALRGIVSFALLSLACLATDAPAGGLVDGDEAYGRRAEGARSGRADARAVREAIDAYAEALASAPESLTARWKLLRALHFEAEFATSDRRSRRRIFEGACELADAGMELLADRVSGGRPLHELPQGEAPRRIAAAGASSHEMAAFYFWAALSWGGWGEAAGPLRALRHGVPGRIRAYAELVLDLEPGYADGGGHRMLAALHARAPRVPFVTGWADPEQALRHAEEALAISPTLSDNRLTLAITLLELDPERRGEALRLLGELATGKPRPEKLLEDLAVRREARERLARERGSL